MLSASREREREKKNDPWSTKPLRLSEGRVAEDISVEEG